jgi:elongation factor G
VARAKLHVNPALVQVPIGLGYDHEGMIDIIEKKSLYFQGNLGVDVVQGDIPKEMESLVETKRHQLIEAVANVDDELADIFLSDQDPSSHQLKEAIRRCVIARSFTPVFVGSALKNKGIQPLLDGVIDYLPDPSQVTNYALDNLNNEEKVVMSPLRDATYPFVGLAFKLEAGRFGQLTYLRIYQGVLNKGDWIYNTRTGKKVKISRLVRMHSDKMEDINDAKAGDICAIFGVDCASGDTFANKSSIHYTMESIHVPDPVIMLSIKPVNKNDVDNFGKGINRFQKEDPTFKVHFDDESKETIISGMGELHLEIYAERLRAEYNCQCITGKPKVAFRETITSPVKFDYLHKKQSGGAGQFGRVIGEFIPLTEGHLTDVVFEDSTIGMNIPKQFIPAIEKGFMEACDKGFLAGRKVVGIHMKLLDGAAHAVDSSELAFKMASRGALRVSYNQANPVILEPIMLVEVSVPQEFQGPVIANLNRRRAVITSTDATEGYCTIFAEVPLNDMFGYATDLRSQTQGKGEFTMEYSKYQIAPPQLQDQLVKDYQDELQSKLKRK